jgi:hypothetical protein
MTGPEAAINNKPLARQAAAVFEAAGAAQLSVV